jgi:hypothetical protein
MVTPQSTLTSALAGVASRPSPLQASKDMASANLRMTSSLPVNTSFIYLSFGEFI